MPVIPPQLRQQLLAFLVNAPENMGHSNGIRWDVPTGCCALLGDTLSADRLQVTRTRAQQICHYTLAPFGLFRGQGNIGNAVLLAAGDRQAVYSPQISTRLPAFYLQSRFDELMPFIQASLA